MAVYNKFDQYVADKANGIYKHDTDQHVVFLTNTLPNRIQSTLSQLSQIDYTNLSTRNITTTSSTQTNGTYKLVLADLVLTASGVVPTFRYVGVYDDTPTAPEDPLIAWYDYGSAVTMANAETFTCDFDQVNGFLTDT